MAQIQARHLEELSDESSQSNLLLHDLTLYTPVKDIKQDSRYEDSETSILRRGYGFPLVGKLLLFVLALWGFVDILQRCYENLPRQFVSNQDLDKCWCGSSDAEAIALGCKYDHLAVDWLPLHCIDEELTAEFDRAGPGPQGAWDYFADKEGSQKLNLSEIDEYAISGKEYFTTRHWHIAHCVYTWRKQFRARYTSKIVEPWNEKEEHIIHCGKYFMEDTELSGLDTVILGVDRHKKEI